MKGNWSGDEAKNADIGLSTKKQQKNKKHVLKLRNLKAMHGINALDST